MQFQIYLLFSIVSFTGAVADFDEWSAAIEKFLDGKIATDPYNVYIDIKSDIKYQNDQCKQLKKDVSFQITYTADLLQYIGSEMSNKSSEFLDKVTEFPEAINTINSNFSSLRDQIVTLPLKDPCYPKVTPLLNNFKNMTLDSLSKTMEFNDNNKIVSSNMLNLMGQIKNIAGDIEGQEMQKNFKSYQAKVDGQLNVITKEYMENVQEILLDLNKKIEMVNYQPREKRPALVKNVKMETQKKLELVRAKTVIDLQYKLRDVVGTLQGLKTDAEELVHSYDSIVKEAFEMANNIQSTYLDTVQAAEGNSHNIKQIAHLTVTTSDGTKLGRSDYIPLYSLDENEEVHSSAKTGQDIIVAIVGTDSEGTRYTRKLYKMFIDDNTDWVYMWIFKDGKVVSEDKFIYKYDQEC